MAEALAVCHQEVIDDDGIILGACDRPDVVARRLDPEDGHTYPVCPEHAVGPLRIQQRRTKDWRKPEAAVAVGRGSRWGNPYRIVAVRPSGPFDVVRDAGIFIAQTTSVESARDIAVQRYRRAIESGFETFPRPDSIRTALAGKTLMCWCPLTGPCHADVLLEYANAHDDEGR